MASDDEINILVIVLDVNPIWWGQQAQREPQFTLSTCLDSLMVMANAHLVMSRTNKLAVIANLYQKSHFLYPKEIRNLMDRTEVNGSQTDSLLAVSLAKALCYIHRVSKDVQAGQDMKSRILVIKAAEDSTLQYMNFMNVTFAAQKKNILIDACVLDTDSGLLQQACDITGGLYLRIPQKIALTQYLLWVFLPDTDQRSQLLLPPPVHVDYRAACFCHRNLIEIGYVCSVCLSIFCNFSPICTTCETAFKMPLPQMAKTKKKKVKTAN
ncbi:general transcription factor IIH subunit 3 isoform X4 [Sinocyclocheilus anshuiensis]|uniref:General transcription factor IIH subunit 3 n=1 Tax=Sinocyclocheilus anshuiensis TaxID=1608454 RepID=A0A671L018_9TELE|nr:PREDICTED: general transcription factor IIH subunit 3 isoform X4 [Sinocyclocheilus anshuiensis]